MKKDNEININSSFEYLLSYIFGKRNYHGSSGLKSELEWKKILTSMLMFIEKSLSHSITNIDSLHKKKLIEICEKTRHDITVANSLDQINQKVILGLVKLIFDLIGKQPDNWDLNKVNNPKHYKLNEFRDIVYIQSNQQKYLYILRLSETSFKGKIPSYKELVEIFSRKCNYDYSKFVGWFKSNYHRSYLEIF